MHNERQQTIATAIVAELDRQSVGSSAEGKYSASGVIDIDALANAIDAVLHAGMVQEGPTPDQLNSSNDD